MCHERPRRFQESRAIIQSHDRSQNLTPQPALARSRSSIPTPPIHFFDAFDSASTNWREFSRQQGLVVDLHRALDQFIKHAAGFFACFPVVIASRVSVGGRISRRIATGTPSRFMQRIASLFVGSETAKRYGGRGSVRLVSAHTALPHSRSPRCGLRYHFGYRVVSGTWQSPVASLSC
jgi:hypothetical protein